MTHGIRYYDLSSEEPARGQKVRAAALLLLHALEQGWTVEDARTALAAAGLDDVAPLPERWGKR